MATYRFPCPKCQSVTPVTDDLAGVSWTCPSCGAKAELPTLMGMRRLERDADESVGKIDAAEIKRRRSRRGLGGALLAFGVLALTLGVAGFATLVYSRPVVPDVQDAVQKYESDLDQFSMDQPPAAAFDEWIRIREIQLDAQERETPQLIALREQREGVTRIMVVAGIVAGLGLAATVAGVLALRGTDAPERRR